jgi:hypothetical protein
LLNASLDKVVATLCVLTDSTDRDTAVRVTLISVIALFSRCGVKLVVTTCDERAIAVTSSSVNRSAFGISLTGITLLGKDDEPIATVTCVTSTIIIYICLIRVTDIGAIIKSITLTILISVLRDAVCVFGVATTLDLARIGEAVIVIIRVTQITQTIPIKVIAVIGGAVHAAATIITTIPRAVII